MVHEGLDSQQVLLELTVLSGKGWLERTLKFEKKGQQGKMYTFVHIYFIRQITQWCLGNLLILRKFIDPLGEKKIVCES